MSSGTDGENGATAEKRVWRTPVVILATVEQDTRTNFAPHVDHTGGGSAATGS